MEPVRLRVLRSNLREIPQGGLPISGSPVVVEAADDVLVSNLVMNSGERALFEGFNRPAEVRPPEVSSQEVSSHEATSRSDQLLLRHAERQAALLEQQLVASTMQQERMVEAVRDIAKSCIQGSSSNQPSAAESGGVSQAASKMQEVAGAFKAQADSMQEALRQGSIASHEQTKRLREVNETLQKQLGDVVQQLGAVSIANSSTRGQPSKAQGAPEQQDALDGLRVELQCTQREVESLFRKVAHAAHSSAYVPPRIEDVPISSRGFSPGAHVRPSEVDDFYKKMSEEMSCLSTQASQIRWSADSKVGRGIPPRRQGERRALAATGRAAAPARRDVQSHLRSPHTPYFGERVAVPPPTHAQITWGQKRASHRRSSSNKVETSTRKPAHLVVHDQDSERPKSTSAAAAVKRQLGGRRGSQPASQHERGDNWRARSLRLGGRPHDRKLPYHGDHVQSDSCPPSPVLSHPPQEMESFGFPPTAERPAPSQGSRPHSPARSPRRDTPRAAAQQVFTDPSGDAAPSAPCAKLLQVMDLQLLLPPDGSVTAVGSRPIAQDGTLESQLRSLLPDVSLGASLGAASLGELRPAPQLGTTMRGGSLGNTWGAGSFNELKTAPAFDSSIRHPNENVRNFSGRAPDAIKPLLRSIVSNCIDDLQQEGGGTERALVSCGVELHPLTGQLRSLRPPLSRGYKDDPPPPPYEYGSPPPYDEDDMEGDAPFVSLPAKVVESPTLPAGQKGPPAIITSPTGRDLSSKRSPFPSPSGRDLSVRKSPVPSPASMSGGRAGRQLEMLVETLQKEVAKSLELQADQLKEVMQSVQSQSQEAATRDQRLREVVLQEVGVAQEKLLSVDQQKYMVLQQSVSQALTDMKNLISGGGSGAAKGSGGSEQTLRISEEQSERQTDGSQPLLAGQQDERKAFISALEKLVTPGRPAVSPDQKASPAMQAEVRTASSATETDKIERVDVGQQASLGRARSEEARIDRFTDLLLNGPPSERMPQGLPKWGFGDVFFSGMMQLEQMRKPQGFAPRSPALSSLSAVESFTSSVDTGPRPRGRVREVDASQTPLSPLSPGQVPFLSSASPGEMPSPLPSSGELSQHDELRVPDVVNLRLRGVGVLDSSGEIEGIAGSESEGELPELEESEGEVSSDSG